ncbi:hypothetical protein LCGC14_2663170 [marine sediment metagenome]|uniref:Uncharacterized protein n=1 Tax=marine sediment metagenome TaxID=412755 RepID=A0A0F8ZRB0_9ZZZZ
MNHCKDCHQDFSPGDRHICDCPGKVERECDKCPSPAKQALRQKISEHIKEKGSITPTDGVFGDVTVNQGFPEGKTLDKKGIQTKFYGCSFLFKGDLDPIAHDSVTVVKRVLMESAFLALKSPVRYILPHVFSWKKAVRGLVHWLSRIYESDLKRKSLQFNHLSPLPRELLRVGRSIANTMSSEYRIEVKNVFTCFVMFFQVDLAYHTRVQDPLSNLDKDRLSANPRKEILRLFDLAISREIYLTEKIGALRKIASMVLLFPPVKRFALQFLMKLDLDKIKPDRADGYFAYRRKEYNFDGLSFEKRMRIIREIDEVKGHTILE